MGGNGSKQATPVVDCTKCKCNDDEMALPKEPGGFVLPTSGDGDADYYGTKGQGGGGRRRRHRSRKTRKTRRNKNRTRRHK
jgi:hypothetical protein